MVGLFRRWQQLAPELGIVFQSNYQVTRKAVSFEWAKRKTPCSRCRLKCKDTAYWSVQDGRLCCTQDLRLSRRHRVPSQGGWRHRAPSRESLRSLGRRVSKTGLCAPRNQPRRVRERERKKDTGPKLWWSKGALMIFLWVYIGCSTRSFFHQW